MKNKLYIMSGCPGSGKTTYAKSHFPNALYVSRDDIRFNLVSEDEEYFSKEDEVFTEFVNTINLGLASGKDVVADATHLNNRSRLKLLRNLDIDRNKTQIEIYYMRPPLSVCIERNEKRKGTRSYVPIDVLKRMYRSFVPPFFQDGICDVYYRVE